MVMAHTLGPKSQAVYDTLHPDLQLIIDVTLDLCTVDFSLVEGHRSVEKQLEYYKKGREFINGRWEVVNKKQVITEIDGHIKKGKHNHFPSLAFDFCVHVPGKPQLAWDPKHLAYLAGSFMMAAQLLFDDDQIDYILRSGSDWDGDGDMTDHRLLDLPHLELIEP